MLNKLDYPLRFIADGFQNLSEGGTERFLAGERNIFSKQHFNDPSVVIFNHQVHVVSLLLELEVEEAVEDREHLLADYLVLVMLGLRLRTVSGVELDGHCLEQGDEVGLGPG